MIFTFTPLSVIEGDKGVIIDPTKQNSFQSTIGLTSCQEYINGAFVTYYLIISYIAPLLLSFRADCIKRRRFSFLFFLFSLLFHCVSLSPPSLCIVQPEATWTAAEG